MDTLLSIVGSVGAVIILGLAAVGIMGLVALFTGTTDDKQRARQQAYLAEQQIAEIGRRAQAAILAEMVRRTQQRGPGDPPSYGGARR